jgi:hypothetical protein
MTPAQRQYDKDLAISLANIAQQIERRSGKLASMLKIAARRIDALSSESAERMVAVPVEQPMQMAQAQATNQPASQAGSSGHA